MALAAGGLGVLASNMKSPEVVQPSVGPNFLQLLRVFTELADQTIGQDRAVFSILYILQSAQEPSHPSVWDLVPEWILHNGDHTFHLILSELSGPFGDVNVCFPQHHMSIIFAPHP